MVDFPKGTQKWRYETEKSLSVLLVFSALSSALSIFYSIYMLSLPYSYIFQSTAVIFGVIAAASAFGIVRLALFDILYVNNVSR